MHENHRRRQADTEPTGYVVACSRQNAVALCGPLMATVDLELVCAC